MRPFVATTAALALALLFSTQVSAQKRTLPDLPNQTVNDFMQDSEGLVWISTNYGICRFNGTEYTNYYHVPSDSTSIPSNRVLCSEEDSDGLIWILTDKALSVHRKGEDSFSTVSHNYGFNGLIRTDSGITAYGNDGFQQLSKNPQVKDAVNEATGDTIAWAEVSPHSGQILAVSADTHNLELYSSSLELRHVFESDTTGFVTCACEDSYSRIWVGTTNGVKVYDHSDGYWKEAVEFKKYLGFLDHTEIKVAHRQ